jgi:FAD/FMN-containing dehydrogenase
MYKLQYARYPFIPINELENMPYLTSQLQVQCAAENKIPFLVAATGHGYFKTYERAKNVLEVDLSNFRDIKVDDNANLITVGGAVRFRDVTKALFAVGKEMRMLSFNST